MLKIDKIVVGMMHTNCYIVSKGSSCVVIDPGASFKRISALLEQNNLRAQAVLLTHGHFDHYGAVAKFQDQGCKVYFNSLDIEILNYLKGLLQRKFVVDYELQGCTELSFGELSFKVISTPGHSKGGTCFLIEGNLFSGDTLFKDVVGYSHLKGGCPESLKFSVQNKLYLLPPETIVHPGHGESTTIGYEMEHNSVILKL